MAKTRQKTEFGDFQTPAALARMICQFLARDGVDVGMIVEPTCGRGNLLLAALDHFPRFQAALGVELNTDYVAALQATVAQRADRHRIVIRNDSFFTVDWQPSLEASSGLLLVIGNPPWVTNSTLGGIDSNNLPRKSNIQNRRGIEALTGKSNFDISEWMLLRMVEWFNNRSGTLAMLCKTAVARKLLAQCWKDGAPLVRASVVKVDAAEHFDAAVDACLLVCHFSVDAVSTRTARVYSDLSATDPETEWGWAGDRLVADVARYQHHSELVANLPNPALTWRSGVKHDCAKVMELRRWSGRYLNGYGDEVDLEPDYLYPMFKSSGIANGRNAAPAHWMLVPQISASDDTSDLAVRAPRTWAYLTRHAAALDGRKSSIYRKRPRFSIFGVGEYTFAPYKVAISGFYKRLAFTVVGSYEDRPVVFDDTVYFLPCHSHRQAAIILELLNSTPAQDLLSAHIFWDAKRPITVEILSRIDLLEVARKLGRDEEFLGLAGQPEQEVQQLQLF